MATRKQENVTLAMAIIGLLIILGAAMYSRTAHGATLSTVQTAISKAKAKGEHSSVVVEAPNKSLVPIEVWKYHEKGCEGNANVVVTDTKLTPTLMLTSIAAHTTLDSGVNVMLADINADGVIESVQYDAILETKPDTATQRLYDAILRCVVES